MSEAQDKQPVTKKYLRDYLAEYSKELLFPEIRTIVDKSNAKFRDEILTSNDKLSVKLDKILKEQAAHTRSYQRLEKRINYLEAVVKVLAEKEGINFNLNPDI